jgi:hypothetical protein
MANFNIGLPKLPSVKDYMPQFPALPKLPDPRQEVRKLQGFYGITQGPIGKFAPKMNSTWARGRGKFR